MKIIYFPYKERNGKIRVSQGVESDKATDTAVRRGQGMNMLADKSQLFIVTGLGYLPVNRMKKKYSSLVGWLTTMLMEIVP